MNLNQVTLAGKLTRDPEIRYTPKGTAVAKIGLAINRRFKSDTGEQKEEATFVDVDVFGKQAEACQQYLKKGSPILVCGRLKLDTWDDKQSGQKRSKLGVVAENVQFGPKQFDDAPGQRRTATPAQQELPASPAKGEDDVPF